MEPPRRTQPGKSERPSEVQDISAVLLHYGADRIPTGGGWRKLKCPIHGERQASATINVDEGAFMCFSCGAKGDALAIIRLQEDCGFLEACVKYKEITGQELTQFARGGNTRRDQASVAETKSYESGGWLASRLRKG